MATASLLLWFGAALVPMSGLAVGRLAGRLVRGRLAPRLDALPRRAHLPLAILVALGFLVGFPVVAQLPLQWLWTTSIAEEDARTTCAAMVTTAAGELAVVAWAATLGQSIGLRRVSSRHLTEAAILAIAAVATSTGWTLLIDHLGWGTTSQRAGAILSLAADPGARTLAIVFVLLAAPLLEEALFRGILYDLVERRRGPRAAILWSGLLFGLLHASDPLVVPVLVLFGWGLGWLRARSGGIPASIWAHILNNLVAVVGLLA